jgi:hypothetical protein
MPVMRFEVAAMADALVMAPVTSVSRLPTLS